MCAWELTSRSLQSIGFQIANPSGQMLLTTGAERSEALTAVGVGPHSVSREWGPAKQTNKC